VLGMTSTTALAVPKTTRAGLDTTRIPDDKSYDQMRSFIVNLVVYQDDEDSNLYYWTPSFRTASTFASSMLKQPDTIQLNEDMEEWNRYLIGEYKKALATVSASGSEVTNSKFESAIAESALADKQGSNETLFSPSAATDLISSLFNKVGKKVQEGYLGGLALSLFTKGLPVPSGDGVDAASFMLRQAKTMYAGELSLRIRSGMSEEQVGLFEDYKKLYPDFKWNVLAAGGDVTVEQIPVSSGLTSEISQGALESAAMLLAGSKLVTHGETGVSIGMTYLGIKSLLDLEKSNGNYYFPMRFLQTVEYPKPVNLNVKCNFNWKLVEELSVRLDKPVSGPVELNVIGGDRTPDFNMLCTKVASDGSQPTNSENEILDSVTHKWINHYTIKRQASLSARDAMIQGLVADAEFANKAPFPTELRSRIVQKMTKECSDKIVQVCDKRILGSCIDWDDEKITECKDVRKDIKEFYSVDLPIMFAKRELYDDSFNESQEFSFTSDKKVPIDVSFPNDICVVFTADKSTGNTSCDQKSLEKSRLESRNDHG
jgi:hypothetical protein